MKGQASFVNYLLVALVCLGLGFVLAFAFFTYQSPEMAFWLDGFALCN